MDFRLGGSVDALPDIYKVVSGWRKDFWGGFGTFDSWAAWTGMFHPLALPGNGVEGCHQPLNLDRRRWHSPDPSSEKENVRTDTVAGDWLMRCEPLRRLEQVDLACAKDTSQCILPIRFINCKRFCG